MFAQNKLGQVRLKMLQTAYHTNTKNQQYVLGLKYFLLSKFRLLNPFFCRTRRTLLKKEAFQISFIDELLQKQMETKAIFIFKEYLSGKYLSGKYLGFRTSEHHIFLLVKAFSVKHLYLCTHTPLFCDHGDAGRSLVKVILF